MRVRIQVGAVTIDLQGVDVSTRTVRALIDQCAERNAEIDTTPEAEPERTPLGFAVITERGDEPEPRSYFTDDDE